MEPGAGFGGRGIDDGDLHEPLGDGAGEVGRWRHLRTRYGRVAGRDDRAVGAPQLDLEDLALADDRAEQAVQRVEVLRRKRGARGDPLVETLVHEPADGRQVALDGGLERRR